MQPETSIHTELEQNDAPPAAGPKRFPKGLRDGYQVHVAALSRGYNVRLLPRQVMEVSPPEGPSHVAGFVHGVPEETTLAGATYAQDLRMRRAMLQQAGFSVPRGATFSVGRSRGLARKFAKRIGFPVVVKPAVGDNTIEVQTGLKNKRQLREAIEYLYTPPIKRKEFTRAAYALTELREPGKINGKVVAPPGYRFLIEQHVHGQYLRFLVIGGEVRNVIYCPEGPWKTRRSRLQDVTETVHQSLKDTAAAAARAVPGLAVVALDIVVPDYEADTSQEDVQIVEFSERPWLSLHQKLDPDLAIRLGGEVLAESIPQSSKTAPKEHITSKVLIGGAVDPDRLLEVLDQRFAELGIEGDLHESDRALGQIKGTVSGSPAQIAWVFERLLDKGLKKQRAMLVLLDPA